jgi:hypothetical protein
MVSHVSYSQPVVNAAMVHTTGMMTKPHCNVAMKSAKPMVKAVFRIITVGAAAAVPTRTTERHVVVRA